MGKTLDKINLPSSWNSLKPYLDKYEIAYDANKGVSDYAGLLQAKNAENSKMTDNEYKEIGLLYKQFLADMEAKRTMDTAQNLAENAARVNTAMNDYVGKKLASYLAEAQGASGMEGYEGLSKGQAINIANSEKNAQQEVQATKNDAISSALQNYQKTVLGNQSAWKDSQEKLEDVIKQTNDTDYNNKLGELTKYVKENQDTEGKLTQTEWNEAVSYIDGLDVDVSVKDDLKKYIDLTYKTSVISDAEAQAKDTQKMKTDINALTRDNFDTFIAGLSAEDKTKYKAELDKKQSELWAKGEATNTAISSSFKGGQYHFIKPDGTKVKGIESITETPLGKGSGKINASEADKWGLPNPDDYGYGDVVRIEKNGEGYYYVKRAGKWYYLVISNDN